MAGLTQVNDLGSLNMEGNRHAARIARTVIGIDRLGRPIRPGGQIQGRQTAVMKPTFRALCAGKHQMLVCFEQDAVESPGEFIRSRRHVRALAIRHGE
jgi:hypothetical protein